MNKKELYNELYGVIGDMYLTYETIKDIAEMLEDFALMNQDDLDRGKGFNLLMDLVKQLRDE